MLKYLCEALIVGFKSFCYGFSGWELLSLNNYTTLDKLFNF